MFKPRFLPHGCLDDNSTGNQCILDNSDNPTLDEVSIRFPSRFLNIVAVNDLWKENSTSALKLTMSARTRKKNPRDKVTIFEHMLSRTHGCTYFACLNDDSKHKSRIREA